MSYDVKAVRWARGWELHIDGVGVTQCDRLDEADEMVRDYLVLDDYPDAATAGVDIHPDVGELHDRLVAMREASATADRARTESARIASETSRALRESGLSVADTAYVLGISKGRVSQLAKAR